MKLASLTCLFCTVAGVLLVHAAAPAQSTGPWKDATSEVNAVLRISRQFLAELTTKKLQRTDPVHLCVEDSFIDGYAWTDATFSVQLDASTQESAFSLQLKGATNSATVSPQRMLQVFGSGRMDFIVRKRVTFDGLKYESKPSTVDATFCTSVDGIETPRGLFGLLIELIATPKIRNSLPLVAHVAFEDGKTKLTEQFDQEAAKLIDKLNEVSPLEKTVTTLIPQTRDWIYYLSTTPTHLIIGAGPRGRRVPELPVTEKTQAPIEFWIRDKPETRTMLVLLKLWKDAGKKLQELLPAEVSQAIKTDDGFRTLTVKEWFVIQLGVGRTKDQQEELGPKPKIAWRPVGAGSATPPLLDPQLPLSGHPVLGNDIWRPVPKPAPQVQQTSDANGNRITLVWRPVIIRAPVGEGPQLMPAQGGGNKAPQP